MALFPRYDPTNWTPSEDLHGHLLKVFVELLRREHTPQVWVDHGTSRIYAFLRASGDCTLTFPLRDLALSQSADDHDTSLGWTTRIRRKTWT